MNLAFILKELSSKIQELDEDDLETLELLLDEEVIEMLNIPESARKYFTHEEVSPSNMNRLLSEALKNLIILFNNK